MTEFKQLKFRNASTKCLLFQFCYNIILNITKIFRMHIKNHFSLQGKTVQTHWSKPLFGIIFS